MITDVLLQNVKVLAIDQDADEKKEKPSVAKAVTLEVTTLQAQKLVLAQKVGSLSLALRNVTNAKAEFVRTVSTADLRISEVSKPVIKKIIMRAVKRPSPVNRLSSVKVVRGLKASEYRVHREGSGIGSPIRLTPRGLSAEKSDRRPNKTSNALEPSRDQGTVATPPPISLDRRRNVLNPNPVSVPPPIMDTPAAVKIRYTGQTSKIEEGG